MNTTNLTPLAATADKVPPRLLDHVKRQLETLAVLTRARRTDEQFGGQGRYEAETYLHHKESLELAWQRLAKFEQLCNEHRVDPSTVYAEIGEPPQLAEAARAWLAASSYASPASTR